MTKPSDAKYREFWFLQISEWGPEISSDPKNHNVGGMLYRIPIKSERVIHVIEKSYATELEEKIKELEKLYVEREAAFILMDNGTRAAFAEMNHMREHQIPAIHNIHKQEIDKLEEQNKIMREALESLTLNDKNKERLNLVDKEALEITVLQVNAIAREALEKVGVE